jgi:DNA-binding beta-propeller fold protein YncE
LRGKTVVVTTLIAIAFTALVLFVSNFSFALVEEKKQSTGFKTYTNPDYNIQIQYPKNWKKSEQDLPAHVLVQFTAPDAKDGSQTAGLMVANYNVGNNTSLDEFVNFFFKDRYAEPSDYKLVSSSDTTFAGMNARQFIVYDYEKIVIPGFSDSTSTLKVMRIFAVDNNTSNGYAIKYWSQPGLFNKYLETAQNMIDSFGVMTGETQNELAPPEQNVKSQPVVKNDNLQFANLDNKFSTKWGTLGSGNGQFHQPRDVAVNSLNGLLYVADTFNNRIQIFDTDGNYISEWGQEGVQDGQFSHPGNIGTSPWGEIYVTDTENSRIQRFNENGTFISKWGGAGTDDNQFNFPGDIAFDPSAKAVFVTDTGNSRIQKFDSNGTFISKWGILGAADGQLNRPTGIAYDDVNKILYVADTNNDRIQRFGLNGTFISNWGMTGNGNGEFKRPTSIVLDIANKVIYVTDTNNHRIQKFDLTGRFISSWGSQGIGDGQFSRPVGIEFDPPNTVYIVDQENNNIQTFASSNKPTSSLTTNEQQNIESQQNSGTDVSQPTSQIDLSTVPEVLTVSEGGNDNDFPLVIALSNDQVSPANSDLEIGDYSFETSEWNPKFTFQFLEGSETSLVNIKQVLVGQIKKYSSPEDALEQAVLWQNVPLNQEVVLKLPDKGLNFMIVQAQFANGATGIYSGAFDLKSFLSKSSDADLLKDDLKENRDWKVMKSSKPDLKKDTEFWQVAQNIACKDLKDYGFETCAETGTGTATGTDNSFTSQGDDLSNTRPLCDTVTTQSSKDLCETLLS